MDSTKEFEISQVIILIENQNKIIERQSEMIKKQSEEFKKLQVEIKRLQEEVEKNASPYVRGKKGVANFILASQSTIYRNDDLIDSLTPIVVGDNTVLYEKDEIKGRLDEAKLKPK